MKLSFWLNVLITLLSLYGGKSKFVQNRGVGRSKDGGGCLDGLRDTQLDAGDFKDIQNSRVTVEKDGKKVNKVKLNEYYLSLPIEGASIVVEYDEDDIDENNPFVDFGVYFEKEYLQEYIQDCDTDLNNEDLKEIIVEDLGTEDFKCKPCQQWIYFVEEIPYHVFICSVHPNGNGARGPSIVHDGEVDANIFSWRFIIDAKTGDILEKLNLLHAATNIHDYSGNQKLGFSNIYEPSSQSTKLYDVSNRAKVLDCNQGYTCSDLICSSSADCETAAQDVNGGKGLALLAYKYVIDTFECYNSYAGGESPVSLQPVPVHVHYGNAYENAFWRDDAIWFGDGANTFYPLICIDVVAHELGHGYTAEHSQLIYSSDSGGMNEAYSDLAGKACELYSKGNYNWNIGQDIFKADGAALRYMNNPPSDGVSIDNYNNFYTSMGVHYSSGVYNKAFYNMVQNGLSIQQVFHVATYANKLYWTAGSTMPQGAEGMIDAADDLNINQWAVEKAFISVNVLDGKCPDFTDYAYCANENGICTVPSDIEYGYISYGVNGQYILMPFTNNAGSDMRYVCNNDIGDIHEGIGKYCCYTKANTNTGFDTSSWLEQKNEGDGWTHHSLLQQRYGHNNQYVYRPVYNTTLWCDNSRFSDPSPGIVKHCNYKWGAPIPTTGWVYCGDDDGQCSGLEPGSAHWIRYGTNEKYLYQLIIGRDGTVPCTNSVFDYSHYGTDKHCDRALASFDAYGNPLFEQPDPRQLPAAPAPEIPNVLSIPIPDNWLYYGGVVSMVSLIVNIGCFCYSICGKNKYCNKTKQGKYAPVNLDKSDQEDV